MVKTIPAGWQEKTLGEVCDIEIGKTPSRSNMKYWDKQKSTTNIWLSIADLNNDTNKNVCDSNEYLSDIGANVVKLVKKGTLLLSFKLTLGRVAFAGKDLRTNEAIAQLPIKNDINKFYLYYYLKFFDYELLLKGDVKVKGKTLNKAKLKLLPVYYPSLPEQERIVAKLDKAFEAIGKAKSIAENNLKNAKELFESSLNKAFTENTNDWEEKKLGEVCIIIAGQSPNSQFYNTEAKGLPFYQGKKEFTNKYIGAPSVWTTEITKEALSGDILMSVRAPVGPINYATEKCCIGRGLASIRNSKLLSKDFLFYYLLSIQQKIGGHDGAVFNSISRSEISAVKIRFPSIPDQQNIVARLDKLQEQTKQLEAVYSQKIKNLDELKQSILKRAFRGEL